MMTEEQVKQQAHDLYVLVCQNARLEGFPFQIVLGAIDRARDVALTHIATYKRIYKRAYPTDDLEHDATREYDLIEGAEVEYDPSQRS